MFLNVAGILIFLSVCGVVTSNPDRSVDCRKFVFAPLCRGVAAKRATLYPRMNIENYISYKPPLRFHQSSVDPLPMEENESLNPHIKPFESAMRPFALEDYESFKKLLKPFEFAMKLVAMQDDSYKAIEKPIESAIKSIPSQGNERACESF